jgi:hypothetical protein
MDGSSRLKMEGDLTLNSATLEAETGTGINLDENASQEVKGDGVTGDFVSLVCSKEATVFSIDATISDSLDAGGEDFTISDGKHSQWMLEVLQSCQVVTGRGLAR